MNTNKLWKRVEKRKLIQMCDVNFDNELHFILCVIDNKRSFDRQGVVLMKRSRSSLTNIMKFHLSFERHRSLIEYWNSCRCFLFQRTFLFSVELTSIHLFFVYSIHWTKEESNSLVWNINVNRWGNKSTPEVPRCPLSSTWFGVFSFSIKE